MKYLVVIAFVALVVGDAEWKPVTRDELIKIHEECSKEAALTDEQINKIGRKERPDEKEVHDYILCNVKRMGIFTEDKGYDAERLLAQQIALSANAVDAREAINKCIDSNEEKSTPAVWAYRVHVCMMNAKIKEVRRD